VDAEAWKKLIEQYRRGYEVVAEALLKTTPEELDARLRSDIDMWAAVVKKAGLEPR